MLTVVSGCSGLNGGLPKDMFHILILKNCENYLIARVNITVYGKDVMKDLEKRILSWIILMGLQFNQRYP